MTHWVQIDTVPYLRIPATDPARNRTHAAVRYILYRKTYTYRRGVTLYRFGIKATALFYHRNEILSNFIRAIVIVRHNVYLAQKRSQDRGRAVNAV